MSVSVLSQGETFDGKFVVLQSLGSGGMGDVYKCRQVGVERFVALKLLNRRLADTSSSLQRFEREAKILSLLDHRGIARFYFYGVSSDKSPFIAMEYVEGEALRQRLRQLGTFAWRDAASIAIQICESLSYAHDRSVIHRDLKPENIILNNEERVVIIDFGLAKVADPNWDSLTQTGELIGTTNYLSPELCRGYRPDHRSDLYSLGIILYEMISGVPPFSADHPMGVIYKHAHEDAPRLSVTDLSVPAQVSWIIAKCIAKEPADRYQSAMELKADLQALINNQVSEIEPPSIVRDSNQGKRGKYAVVGIFVLSVVCSYFVIVANSHDSKIVASQPSPGLRKRIRKLTVSDNQLRHKSLEELLEQFETFRRSNQHAEAQNIVQRWVLATEKERPLTDSEIGETALSISRSQSEVHDFTSALKTDDAALKQLEGRPEGKTFEIQLLISQIACGAANLEFSSGGESSRLQQAAKKLQGLLEKNAVSEETLIEGTSSVVDAKIRIRHVNDALALIERTCSRISNCLPLMRLKAECLFLQNKIDEGKVAARQYGSYNIVSQYQVAPSKEQVDVLAALKAAQCAAAASRYDVAMELLKPTLKTHENVTNFAHADALIQYSDWILLMGADSAKPADANLSAPIEESLTHLKEAFRISHVLGMPAFERTALVKIACRQLLLDKEKMADATLRTALGTMDQESPDDVKANVASGLLDNLPWVSRFHSNVARLAILKKANEILEGVQSDRYATIKEETLHSLQIAEETSKIN